MDVWPSKAPIIRLGALITISERSWERGALTTPSDTATDTDEYGVRYTIRLFHPRPSDSLSHSWLPLDSPACHSRPLTPRSKSTAPLTFSFSPQALPLSHLPLPALCPDPRSTLLRLLPPYPLLEKSISPLSLYTRSALSLNPPQPTSREIGPRVHLHAPALSAGERSARRVSEYGNPPTPNDRRKRIQIGIFKRGVRSITSHEAANLV